MQKWHFETAELHFEISHSEISLELLIIILSRRAIQYGEVDSTKQFFILQRNLYLIALKCFDNHSSAISIISNP